VPAIFANNRKEACYEIWVDRKDHRALAIALNKEKQLNVTVVHAELERATETDINQIVNLGSSIFRYHNTISLLSYTL
jgi:hypothetical protein